MLVLRLDLPLCLPLQVRSFEAEQQSRPVQLKDVHAICNEHGSNDNERAFFGFTSQTHGSWHISYLNFAPRIWEVITGVKFDDYMLTWQSPPAVYAADQELLLKDMAKFRHEMTERESTGNCIEQPFALPPGDLSERELWVAFFQYHNAPKKAGGDPFGRAAGLRKLMMCMEGQGRLASDTMGQMWEDVAEASGVDKDVWRNGHIIVDYFFAGTLPYDWNLKKFILYLKREHPEVHQDWVR